MPQTGVIETLPWWVYFAWGLVGGFIIDGMEYVRVIRANDGQLPAKMRTPWAFASVMIRLAIGGLLAALFGLSGQAPTPLSAAIVGIAAPTILEKLAQTVPPVSKY